MTYIDRILSLKQELGLSNENFARITGIPLPITEDIINGKIKDLCFEILDDIEEAMKRGGPYPNDEDPFYDMPNLLRDAPAAYDNSPAMQTTRLYTVEDLTNLPEKMRVELIEGRLHYMSTPDITHQRISGELFYSIHQYIRSKGGSCETLLPPLGVLIDKNIFNYLIPDLMVVCDPAKIRSHGIYGAPDWVIEIVSPSSRQADYIIKMQKYRSAGVCEYWIIDPDEKKVTVYDFVNLPDSPVTYTFDDTIRGILYPDLNICIGSMLSHYPDIG